MTVPIVSITVDAGTQVRANIDPAIVAHYAERMAAGDVFPPIVLMQDADQLFVADGFHRLRAACKNLATDIDADVRPGSQEDALWFALAANKANGHRLTDADLHRAVELAILRWPDRSQNLIAEHIGVSQSTVQRVKELVMQTHILPGRTIGRDGKSYPAVRMAVNRQAVEERLAAGEAPVTIAKALGISRTTVASIRDRQTDRSPQAAIERRMRIHDLAGLGYSKRQIARMLHITRDHVGKIARAEGIVIPADRIIGRVKHHNAARIVETIVMDAENLTNDIGLINFSELDPEQVLPWLTSLDASRKALVQFIQRLRKECSRHVETH